MLLSNWGKHNRVVTEELTTQFRRENKRDSGFGWQYFEYTRIRTKKYKYIALTREAAIACANALNRFYNRATTKWQVHQSSGESPYWAMHQPDSPKDYIYVQCGRATPSLVKGDAWEVIVDVNEEITIPWRQQGDPSVPSALPSPWTAFEANPTIKTIFFRGFNDGTEDFTYDDGDNGIGSEVDE